MTGPRAALAVLLCALLATPAAAANWPWSRPDPRKQRELVQDQTLIVPGKSVGSLLIGMPMADVEKAWGAGEKVGPRGRIRHYERYGIDVHEGQDRIVRGIFVVKPAYRTREGLGVGATGARVLKAYGKPQGESKNRFLGTLDLVYTQRGVAFGLNGDRSRGKVVHVLVLPPMARKTPGRTPRGKTSPAARRSPAPAHH